jgi:hypothetical protein
VSSSYYVCVLIGARGAHEEPPAAAPSCVCVLILLYMCPHTTIYVSSHYYICVLILLYMCPQYYYMCPHTTICVLILLYMCPHTTINVSSYYYICVLILLSYVPLYYCICVRTGARGAPEHAPAAPSCVVARSTGIAGNMCIHSTCTYMYIYIT